MTADPIQEQPLPAEDIKKPTPVSDSDAPALDASKTDKPLEHKDTDAHADGLKNSDESQDGVKHEKSSDDTTENPIEEKKPETEKEAESSRVLDLEESDTKESKSGEPEKPKRNSKDKAKSNGSELNGNTAELASFIPGTVVLAKVKGFPAWPGIVSWVSVLLRDAN